MRYGDAYKRISVYVGKRACGEALNEAMRWAIIGLMIGILLVLLVLPAFAMPGDNMDLRTFFAMEKMDYSQKLTYLAALAALDLKQTTDYIVTNKNNYEVNPILGPHPTHRDLQMVAMVGIASAWVFMKYFPEGVVKHVILDSVIASEQANIREDRDLYQHHKTSMPIMVVASIQF